MATDPKTCTTCRYVRIPTEEEKKQKMNMACRRFPPQTHFIVVLRQDLAAGGMVPREEQRSAFPIVLADWTCAEYAPRLELTS